MIPWVDVAHRRGPPALGHDGVGLAEQALRDQAGVETPCAALDGRAQAGAPRADHDHVVLYRLQLTNVHGL